MHKELRNTDLPDMRFITPYFVLFVSCVAAEPPPAPLNTLFRWPEQPISQSTFRPLSTDRPDFTEASNTVGLDVVQIEAGYTWTDEIDGHSHSWGEPLLRTGILANWLELRLAAFPVTSKNAAAHHGLEDLYTGLKLALTSQHNWLPEVALLPQMTVPTGSSQLSNQHWLPGLNLLYSWELDGDISLAGSTQYNRISPDQASVSGEWAQSVALGKPVTEDIAGYFEWYTIQPVASSEDEHYINGGFTWSPTADSQFDIRVGHGLNNHSAPLFVGFGYTVRYR